jgi:hypothetical protein
MMSSIFVSVGVGREANPELLFDILKIVPVVMAILLSVFFGWFWSIGVGLQYKIPKDVKMKVDQFKFFFFVPIFYFSLIITGISLAADGYFQTDFDPPSTGVIIGLVTSGILLHLFSMFCMIHSLYFIAKTIKTIELQKEVRFSDFIGEFFMIWFYPVGIWIIQPRINKIYEDELDA